MAMSFEDFKRIVNDVKDITHSIYLTNAGEPLLNKEIFRMIKYAEQNNLRVSLSTNATLLNKTAVKNLLNSGLDLLIVSIDGVSKSSYEKFRRGAIFEEVIRNVTFLCDQKKKMKKLKPIIEWQFIVTKLNQNELGKIKKLSKKMGVDRVRIKTLYLCSHIYDKHERKKFAEEFLPTRKDVKSRYEIKDNALICKWRSKTCTYWQKRSVILVDGTVCMCCYDINGEYIFGNVYLKSFKDIWNSKKYRYYRKYLIFNKKLPLCQRCQK
jgi:radical SAM protein with 4Fe4S-binding SPASM domain